MRSAQTILVLDFGSQTSHLILRRLRSLNVYAEMLSCTTKLSELDWKPVGIILSGGMCDDHLSRDMKRAILM